MRQRPCLSPAGTTVKDVTLDGKSVEYTMVDTTRGREVRVETTTDQRHTLVVITG